MSRARWATQTEAIRAALSRGVRPHWRALSEATGLREKAIRERCRAAGIALEVDKRQGEADSVQLQRITAAILAGAATATEIAQATGLNWHTVVSRCGETGIVLQRGKPGPKKAVDTANAGG